MYMQKKNYSGALLALRAVLLVSLIGCSTKEYDANQGPTGQVISGATKVGVPLLTGAAGYGIAKAAGADDLTSIAAATGGLLLGGGIIVWNESDKKRIADFSELRGEQKAFKKIVDKDWEREAVYGIKEGKKPGIKKTRTVYVPAQKVNGVQIPGHNETIEYYGN